MIVDESLSHGEHSGKFLSCFQSSNLKEIVFLKNGSHSAREPPWLRPRAGLFRLVFPPCRVGTADCGLGAGPCGRETRRERVREWVRERDLLGTIHNGGIVRIWTPHHHATVRERHTPSPQHTGECMQTCTRIWTLMSIKVHFNIQINARQHERDYMSTCTRNFNMYVNKNYMQKNAWQHGKKVCQHAFKMSTCMSVKVHVNIQKL